LWLFLFHERKSHQKERTTMLFLPARKASKEPQGAYPLTHVGCIIENNFSHFFFLKEKVTKRSKKPAVLSLAQIFSHIPFDALFSRLLSGVRAQKLPIEESVAASLCAKLTFSTKGIRSDMNYLHKNADIFSHRRLFRGRPERRRAGASEHEVLREETVRGADLDNLNICTSIKLKACDSFRTFLFVQKSTLFF
jgi:hypothetical protein